MHEDKLGAECVDDQAKEPQSNVTERKQVEVNNAPKLVAVVPEAVVSPVPGKGGGGGAVGASEGGARNPWLQHFVPCFFLVVLMIVGGSTGSDAACLLIGVAIFFCVRRPVLLSLHGEHYFPALRR